MSVTTFDPINRGSTAPTIVTDYEEFPDDVGIGGVLGGEPSPPVAIDKTFSSTDGIDVWYGTSATFRKNKPNSDTFINWNATWTGRIVKDRRFKRLIFLLIVANSIEMLVSTFLPPENTLLWIRRPFLWIFSAEIVLKFIHYRHRMSPWYAFDFIVILSGWFCSSFLILRTFRFLKSIRHFSRFPALRQLRLALGQSIGGLLSTLVILAIVFAAFAVCFTGLYSESMPEHFGHLDTTLWTLLQLMTLDRWTETFQGEHFWGLAIFVFCTTYFVSKLWVGVMVESVVLQRQQQQQNWETTTTSHNTTPSTTSSQQRLSLSMRANPALSKRGSQLMDNGTIELERKLDELASLVELLVARQQKLEDTMTQTPSQEESSGRDVTTSAGASTTTTTTAGVLDKE